MVFEFTVSYILKLFKFDAKPLNQDVSDIISPKHEQVPAPIQRLFPQIGSVQALKLQATDPKFLYESVKVCDMCYGELKQVMSDEMTKMNLSQNPFLHTEDKQQVVNTEEVKFSAKEMDHVKEDQVEGEDGEEDMLNEEDEEEEDEEETPQ